MEDPAAKQTAHGKARASSLSDHINQNVADVVALQEREFAETGLAQRRLENISRAVGQPFYIVGLLLFIVLWVAFNLSAARLGLAPFDKPPFQWLQGLLTLIALLTATVVLIAQSRQTRLSEQRAHLDLQINLLTEQKVTTLIHLVEELREDLPTVRDRPDAHVSALKESTDAAQVASALKDTGLTGDAGSAQPKKK
jgi:uncharacterized membrane protein